MMKKGLATIPASLSVSVPISVDDIYKTHLFPATLILEYRKKSNPPTNSLLSEELSIKISELLRDNLKPESQKTLLESLAEHDQRIALNHPITEEELNLWKQSRLLKPDRRILVDHYVKACFKNIGQSDDLSYSELKSIHELSDPNFLHRFEAYTKYYPNKIALIFKDNKLTYQELNQRANQLAHVLMNDYHINKEDRVATFVPRSPDWIIALLAIWKAGAAFVALDTQPPAGKPRDRALYVENLQKRTANANLTLVITTTLCKSRVSDQKTLCIDEFDFLNSSNKDPKRRLQPNDLAYIMYTSGSTGEPKGVQIEHKGLVPCLEAHRACVDLTQDTIMAQYAAPSFDAWLAEMLILGIGGTLCMIPNDLRHNPTLFTKYCNDHKVSTMILTPQFLKQLYGPEHFPCLASLFIVGEKFGWELVNTWFRENNTRKIPIQVVNGYGLTETTICATLQNLAAYQSTIEGKPLFLPIGAPIIGTQIQIFTPIDKNEAKDTHSILKGYKAPVSPDFEGELFIAGLSLTRDYFGVAKEENIDKFAEIDDIRYYKTGDKAKCVDGVYQVIGRYSRDIKINGVRINLDGLEAIARDDQNETLSKIIAEAAFVCDQNDEDNPVIVANIIPKDKGLLSNATIDTRKFEDIIRNELKSKEDRLSGKCFEIRWVKEFDKTTNGKIDYEKLLFDSIHDIKQKNGPFERHDPSSDTQKDSKKESEENNLSIELRKIIEKIKEIWTKVSGKQFLCDERTRFDQIGINSIKLFDLNERLCSEFDIKENTLKSVMLIEHPTLYQQAQLIYRLTNRLQSITLKKSEETSHYTLYCLPSIMGNPKMDYQEMINITNETFPELEMIGFKARGLYDPGNMPVSIESMATDYMHSILNYRKDRNSKGPIFVMGWSSGGTVAIEAVKQLRERGAEAFAYAIDTLSPFLYQQFTSEQLAKELILLANLLALKLRLNCPLEIKDLQKLKTLDQIDFVFNALLNAADKGEIQSRNIIQVAKTIRIAEQFYFPEELPEFTLFTASKQDLIDGGVVNSEAISHSLNWPRSCFIGKAPQRIQSSDHFSILSTPSLHQSLKSSFIFHSHDFIKKIRQYYISNEFSFIQPLFLPDPLPLRDIYVNLTIETAKKQQESETKALSKKNDGVDESENEYRDERIKSYEEIFSKKEPIEISNIFDPVTLKNKKPSNGERPKRKLLILGRAGIGKSTLSKYIAHQWASGQLWNDRFDLVILIKLRDLKGLGDSELTLNQVICKQCLPEEEQGEISDEMLTVMIKSLGQRVLFLLDGFDEVATEYDKRVSETNRRTPLSNVLHQLIDKNQHSIVMTSRPNYIQMINRLFSEDDCHRLETIGYTDENIAAYLKKFYNQLDRQDQAPQLLEVLRTNPNLWGIAHVPINLELICSIWQDSGGMQDNQKNDTKHVSTFTMTKLYEQGTVWLLRKHYHRTNPSKKIWRKQNINQFEQSEQYKNKLLFLERLAWESEVNTKNNSILISGESQLILELIEQYFPNYRKDTLDMDGQNEFIEGIVELGFWKSIDVKIEQDDSYMDFQDKAYYFMHLTFQEFFAARYWVRMYCSEVNSEREEAGKLFKHYKYDPRFEIIWWFVAGLLRTQSQPHLNHFFILLQDEPRELVGLQHFTLLTRCLEEGGLELTNHDHLNNLFDEVIKWIDWAIQNINRYQKFFHEMNRMIRSFLRQCVRLYSHPKIIDHLCKQLANIEKEDDAVIWKTLLFLIEVPSWHPRIIHYLSLGLNNLDHDIRRLVVKVLTHLPLPYLEIGSECRNDCAKSLLRALRDHNSDVQSIALEALKATPWSQFEALQNAIVEEYFNLLNDFDKHSNSFKKIIIEAVPWSQLPVELHIMLVRRYLSGLKDPCRFLIYEATKILPHLQLSLALREELADECLLALENPNSSIRFNAITAIIEIYLLQLSIARREALITVYLNALMDVDFHVRFYSLSKLERLPWAQFSEAQQKLVVQAFASALRDLESSYRGLFISIFKTIWPSLSKVLLEMFITECLDALNDINSDVRLSVMEVLKLLSWLQLSESQQNSLINGFLGVLRVPKKHLRYSAVKHIKELPWLQLSESQQILLLTSLFSALKDDPYVRFSIVFAIASLPWSQLSIALCKVLIAECLVAMNDTNADVRSSVIEVMPSLPWNQLSETLQEKLVNAHLSALNDIKSTVRSSAINTIGKLPLLQLPIILRNQLITACIEAIKDPRSVVRSSVVKVMVLLPWTQFSETLQKALVHAHLIALNDLRSVVRSSAILAIGKLPWLKLPIFLQELEVLIKACLFALHDDNADVRSSAMQVIELLPWSSISISQQEALVQTFLSALKDLEGTVRIFAIQAIGKLPWLKLSIALREFLITECLIAVTHDNSKVRSSVVNAIGMLLGLPLSETEQNELLKGCYRALEDSDEYVRYSGIYVIGSQSWSLLSRYQQEVVAQRYSCALMKSIRNDYSVSIVKVIRRLPWATLSLATQEMLLKKVGKICRYDNLNVKFVDNILRNFDYQKINKFHEYTETFTYDFCRSFLKFCIQHQRVIFLDTEKRSIIYLTELGDAVTLKDTLLVNLFVRNRETLHEKYELPSLFQPCNGNSFQPVKLSTSRYRFAIPSQYDSKSIICDFENTRYTLTISQSIQKNKADILINNDSSVQLTQRNAFIQSLLQFINIKCRERNIIIEFTECNLSADGNEIDISWLSDQLSQWLSHDFEQYVQEQQQSWCVLC